MLVFFTYTRSYAILWDFWRENCIKCIRHLNPKINAAERKCLLSAGNRASNTTSSEVRYVMVRERIHQENCKAYYLKKNIRIKFLGKLKLFEHATKDCEVKR